MTQPTERLEELTDEKRIASHTSQLTNLRQHDLEKELDQMRILVRSNPSRSNIIRYFGIIDAIFSYIRSIQQNEDDRNDPTFFDRINKIASALERLRDYWGYITYPSSPGVYSRLLIAKHNKNVQIAIEKEMTLLCDLAADNIRLIYQSMGYYFRIDKSPRMGGILGDYVNARKKKTTKEVKKNELETAIVVEASSNG